MRADGRPIAGRDYPRTWQEFEAWFPDEGACRQYLERLRWPDGFICPRCASRQGWRSKRGLWVCGGCQRQTSVTAGTVFADTHSLLRTWFATAWYVTGQKQGVSALGLQAVLGLGSYETAWSWLHKLRRAMVRPGRDQLFGDVEMDETYVGGPEPWAFGRRTTSKSIVAIAVERRGRVKLGRVRMARVPNLSIPTMTDFATTALERGSTIRADGLSSYRGLVAAGYRHQVITLKAVEEPAHPGRGASPPPRLLPRRIHLPLQPTRCPASWPALLPTSPASRRHPPGHRRSAHGKASQHVGVTGVKRIGRFVNG